MKGIILFGALIALIIIGINTISLAHTFTYGTEDTITIVEKYQKRSDESDIFFVVAGDGQVFTNSDSIYHLKFDSASLQARLKVGSTYKVTSQGFRFPILSMFKNIIIAEKAEK